jgi:plastocyanin
MNKKIITGLVLAILVFGGLAVMAQRNNEQQQSDVSMAEHEDTDNHSEVKETNQVIYKDFEVMPSVIKITKGTTVTWTNQDSARHDVTPDKETSEFKASELFGKGKTHSVTFNTIGSYDYHCSPHPYMKGTIEVVE